MLAGNIYVGHDSVPSPEYRRDLEARHGALDKAGDPPDVFASQLAKSDALARATLAKVDALAADTDALSKRIDAVGRSIEQLKASNQVSDQIGRPEHMSPTAWAERAI